MLLETPVNPEGMETDRARSLVARALSVSVEVIGPEARMYEIPLWDSMGQLSIILAIEEALQVQIKDESIFEPLTSVSDIARYLWQSGH